MTYGANVCLQLQQHRLLSASAHSQQITPFTLLQRVTVIWGNGEGPTKAEGKQHHSTQLLFQFDKYCVLERSHCGYRLDNICMLSIILICQIHIQHWTCRIILHSHKKKFCLYKHELFSHDLWTKVKAKGRILQLGLLVPLSIYSSVARGGCN